MTSLKRAALAFACWNLHACQAIRLGDTDASLGFPSPSASASEAPVPQVAAVPTAPSVANAPGTSGKQDASSVARAAESAKARPAAEILAGEPLAGTPEVAAPAGPVAERAAPPPCDEVATVATKAAASTTAAPAMPVAAATVAASAASSQTPPATVNNSGPSEVSDAELVARGVRSVESAGAQTEAIAEGYISAAASEVEKAKNAIASHAADASVVSKQALQAAQDIKERTSRFVDSLGSTTASPEAAGASRAVALPTGTSSQAADGSQAKHASDIAGAAAAAAAEEPSVSKGQKLMLLADTLLMALKGPPQHRGGWKVVDLSAARTASARIASSPSSDAAPIASAQVSEASTPSGSNARGAVPATSASLHPIAASAPSLGTPDAPVAEKASEPHAAQQQAAAPTAPTAPTALTAPCN